MKTTQLTILALLLSAYILNAQTEKKPTTVRMKTKVVKNGVSTVTDTTFETTDPSKIIMIPADGKRDAPLTIEQLEKQTMNETIIIATDESLNLSDLKNSGVVALHLNIDSLINETVAGSPPKEGEQYILKKVRCNATKDELEQQRDFITITIHKRIDINEADEEDIKQLGKQNGINYNKLELQKLDFYPNPNDGKFTMSFNTNKKLDTEITIQNIEGKVIYQEHLAGFSGSYTKNMDISENPKGVYFVIIRQGNNAQIKKIVIE